MKTKEESYSPNTTRGLRYLYRTRLGLEDKTNERGVLYHNPTFIVATIGLQSRYHRTSSGHTTNQARVHFLKSEHQ